MSSVHCTDTEFTPLARPTSCSHSLSVSGHMSCASMLHSHSQLILNQPVSPVNHSHLALHIPRASCIPIPSLSLAMLAYSLESWSSRLQSLSQLMLAPCCVHSWHHHSIHFTHSYLCIPRPVMELSPFLILSTWSCHISCGY